MSYEIEPDRSQTFLLPPALDDWVPPDHPARFIASFVDSVDLQALKFKVGHAPTGRPRYSARLLLSVVCYCYFSRIRTLRAMELACRENVALMWLTGLEAPDHNTLWRFWRENRESLRGLLAKSVRVAADMGLIGMVLHAVDGTKIRAQASMKTASHRRLLKAALEKLEESIRQMEQGLAESAEEGLGSCRLPDDLVDAQRRKGEIERRLEALQEAQTDSLNPHEPDARVMKCRDGLLFGYNAQAVADDAAGIVVAADALTQETDNGLLAQMIEKAAETTGQPPPETLADKGYASEQDLGQASEKNLPVLVNLPKNVAPRDGTSPFHKTRFTYDPERDCCICPLGNTLEYQRSRKNRGHTLRVYHCGCYKACPIRDQCSSNKRGRTIELGEHFQAVMQQIQRHQHPSSKDKLARRGVIIEPVFAFIKENLGFRRWTVRELDGVRTQWALMCTTVNLHKLYRSWKQARSAFA